MRRLAVLIGELPSESAFMRAQSEDGWSEQERLTALVAHVSHIHVRTTVAAAGVKKSKVPKPLDLKPPHKRNTTRPQHAPMTRQSIRAAMLNPGGR